MNRLFYSVLSGLYRCHLLPESLNHVHTEYSTYDGAGFVLVRYSFLTAHRVNQVLDSLPAAHIKRGGTVRRVATLIADAPDARQIYNRLPDNNVRATN